MTYSDSSNRTASALNREARAVNRTAKAYGNLQRGSVSSAVSAEAVSKQIVLAYLGGGR